MGKALNFIVTSSERESRGFGGAAVYDLGEFIKARADVREVIYVPSIPECAELIEGNGVSGVIVPLGHADVNVVENLREILKRKIHVPVFEAFKYIPFGRGYDSRAAKKLRYAPVETVFTAWLRNNFSANLRI